MGRSSTKEFLAIFTYFETVVGLRPVAVAISRIVCPRPASCAMCNISSRRSRCLSGGGAGVNRVSRDVCGLGGSIRMVDVIH